MKSVKFLLMAPCLIAGVQISQKTSADMPFLILAPNPMSSMLNAVHDIDSHMFRSPFFTHHDSFKEDPFFNNLKGDGESKSESFSKSKTSKCAEGKCKVTTCTNGKCVDETID